MGGRVIDPAAVGQAKPGREIRIDFMQADDARSALEMFPTVAVEAGGPAIAEADAVEGAGKIIDMVVPGIDAPDIAGKVHGGEQAGVDARTADILVFFAQAGALMPDIIVFWQRDVENRR